MARIRGAGRAIAALALGGLLAALSLPAIAMAAPTAPLPNAVTAVSALRFRSLVTDLSPGPQPGDLALTLADGSGWLVRAGGADQVVPPQGIDPRTPLQWVPGSDWLLYGAAGRFHVLRPGGGPEDQTVLPRCASAAAGVTTFVGGVAYWCHGDLYVRRLPSGAVPASQPTALDYHGLPPPALGGGFSVDPSGTYVAISVHDGVNVFSLVNRRARLALAGPPASAFAWEGGGRALAFATATAAYLWRPGDSSGAAGGLSSPAGGTAVMLPGGAGARWLTWTQDGSAVLSLSRQNVGLAKPWYVLQDMAWGGPDFTVTQGTLGYVLDVQAVGTGAVIWREEGVGAATYSAGPAGAGPGPFSLRAVPVSLAPPAPATAGYAFGAGRAPGGSVVSTLAASPFGGDGPQFLAVGPGGALYDAFSPAVDVLRDGSWRPVCQLPSGFTAMTATPHAVFLGTQTGGIYACRGRGVSLLYSGSGAINALAADASGDLYFVLVGQGNRGTRVMERYAGGRVRLVAGESAQQALAENDQVDQSRDGPGYLASFASPPLAWQGACWDPRLGLVLTDGPGQSLRVVRPDGSVYTLLQSRPWGYSDGPPVLASARSFMDVACDAQGDVFFTDPQDARVRVWVYATDTVRTVAGSGEMPGQLVSNENLVGGLTGGYRDGPGHQALFGEPEALALSPDGGTLFVGDGFTSPGGSGFAGGRIRQVVLTRDANGAAPELALPDAAAGIGGATVAPVDLPLGVQGVRLKVNGRPAPGAVGLPGGAFIARAGVKLELTGRVDGRTVSGAPVVLGGSGAPFSLELPDYAWTLPPEGSWVTGQLLFTVLNPSATPLTVVAAGRTVGTVRGLLSQLTLNPARWPDGRVSVALPGPHGDFLVASLRLIAHQAPAVPRVPTVLLNGRSVTTPIANNFIHDGQPYLPLSPALTMLGFQTSLSPPATIHARLGGVVLTLDKRTGLTRGVGGTFVASPPVEVVRYYTFVPASWFHGALGARVTWDPRALVATIRWTGSGG